MNEPSRAAWRIGAFAVSGLAVLLAAIVVVGGRWFSPTESAAMRFSGSVWGLQVGAPVVLRGVRVGEVTRIGLGPLAGRSWPPGEPAAGVAVSASFDATRLRDLLGEGLSGPALPLLIDRGLVARVSTQSLLTGLLYVDLDLDPRAAAASKAAAVAQGSTAGSAGDPAGVPVIPTATTRMQDLQAQVEALDLQRLVQDLGAAAQALRALTAGSEIRLALSQVTRAASEVSQLGQQMRAEVAPAGAALRETLEQVRRATNALEPLAREAQSAAQQVALAASQVGALAVETQPLVKEFRASADELTRTAQSLRQAMGGDSALRRQAEAALGEIARAATAMRALAEMLERNPESLLRGRQK